MDRPPRRIGAVRSRLRSVRLAALAVAGGSSFGLACADPVVATFAAVADTTLFAESGDLASGADDGVFAGVNGNTGGFADRRALLRFDLSALPAGANLTAATLTLNVTRTNHAGAVTNSLYRVTSPWGEGTSTAPRGGGGGGAATAGSATWVYRFWNTAPWSASGGDFLATPSAETLVGDVGSYVWSSPGLITDIQAWVQAPASNFGWILIAAPIGGTTAKRYASREFADPQQRPMLTITYDTLTANDVPLPTWAYTALGAGMLGVATLALRRKAAGHT
jgi:hypothetical protein